MRTTRGTWVLLAGLAACGGGEEPGGTDWGDAFEACDDEVFDDGAYSVRRWKPETEVSEEVGARAAKWAGGARRGAPAVEEKGPAFPGRGAQLSSAGRRIADKLEPSMEEWPDEVFAQAAERALAEAVEKLVGGSLAGLHVDRAEWNGDGGTTRALVRLGILEDGARRQRDAVWSCRWSGTAQAPLLMAVDVLSATEVSCRTPVFEDVTEAVFGALPFWEQELLLGNDAYHQRTDAKVAFFFAGLLGMAVGDVDGDGWEDVYLSQLGGQPNRLLTRGEEGAVVDATAAAEVGFLDTTRGALLVDLDGDGHLDLAVGKGAEVALCWNDGKGRFGQRNPLDGPGKSPIYSISAGDGDGDGDLDLFCCRYPHASLSGGVPSPYHEAMNGARNLYWRNEGGRSFVECAEEVGLGGVNRFTYMAVFEDYDSDGDQDLYVVNDYGTNQLYESEGGRFTDVAATKGALNPAAGMGLSVADCDLDGNLDLYVSNMHTPIGARIAEMKGFRDGGADLGAYRMHAAGNALLFGDGAGAFTDRGAASGVAVGGWSWGAVFGDWNSDGWPDLYVPNGFVSGDREDELASLYWRELVKSSPETGDSTAAYRDAWLALGHLSQWDGYSWAGNERNHAYLNVGGGEFVDVSHAGGVDFLDDGRVASAVDWDGDGHLDLLLRNRTGPRLRLLRGTGAAGGGSLSLDLSHPAPNTGGVGARVKVELSDGRILSRTKYAGEGLLGQSSHRLHFGLGAAAVKTVEVRWPDGVVEGHEGLNAGRWKIPRGAAPEREATVASSALAGRGAESLSVGRGRASRVVLADKLPAKAWSFPGERGGRISLESILSQPGRRGALVVVWDPEQEADRAFLEALGEEAGEMEKDGVVVVPMRRGDPDAAAGFLAGLGMDAHAARMTQMEERLVHLFLLEVIGLHEEAPMPVSLLFDSGGGLCALYFGPDAAGLVAGDAGKLRYANPALPDTTAITGGFWLARPRRDRAKLSRGLEMLGARELARGLGG